MPLITLTVQRPKTTDFKSGVLAAVHGALVASSACSNSMPRISASIRPIPT
jgi:hypothetical protein